MNIFILSVALLTLGAHGEELDYSICQDSFNEYRRKVAQSDQIANMIKLEYVADMEYEISLAIGYRDSPNCGQAKMFRNEDVFIEVKPNDWVAAVGSYPGTTHAACLQQYCRNQNANVIGVASTTYPLPPIRGPPGSACLKDYVNDNGLCKRETSFWERFYKGYRKAWIAVNYDRVISY